MSLGATKFLLPGAFFYEDDLPVNSMGKTMAQECKRLGKETVRGPALPLLVRYRQSRRDGLLSCMS